MAIQLPIRIHASEAVPPVPEAYLMIKRVDADRLMGQLTLHLAVFASASDRDKVRTCFTDAQRAQSDAAKAGLEHSRATNDLDRQIAAGKHAEAEQRFANAKQALAQAQGIQPVDMPLQVLVPPGEVALCCDEAGNVTIDRCYAWLAEQGAYAGTAV